MLLYNICSLSFSYVKLLVPILYWRNFSNDHVELFSKKYKKSSCDICDVIFIDADVDKDIAIMHQWFGNGFSLFALQKYTYLRVFKN